MPATEPIKWPAQTASSMNPASFRSLPAVEAAGLVKRFGDATAVDGLDLSVAAETVVALLGPNGAGKTTTLRMLATLLRPDAGSARVLGHDVEGEADAVRARISLTGQLASVDDDLTGLENLVLLGRLLGHSRRDARRPAAWSRATPGGCGGDSTSRPASSSGQSCSSWTSPRRGSTRAVATRSGSSSAHSSRAARRCCSRRSTWTRPTSSPTGSPSSITAP